MPIKRKKSLTAADWANQDGKSQEISNAYREAVSSTSRDGGWDADEIHGSLDDQEVVVLDVVAHHPYSMLFVGKSNRLTVIPVCRSTDEGRFILIGDEVSALFCDAGQEIAYTVWEKLQYCFLMHQNKTDGIWNTGSNAITEMELLSHFPKRQLPWLRKQLKVIKQIVGLYVETRNDRDSGERLGRALVPMMMYRPPERTFEGIVPGEVTRFDQLKGYLVKKPKTQELSFDETPIETNSPVRVTTEITTTSVQPESSNQEFKHVEPGVQKEEEWVSPKGRLTNTAWYRDTQELVKQWEIDKGSRKK